MKLVCSESKVKQSDIHDFMICKSIICVREQFIKDAFVAV